MDLSSFDPASLKILDRLDDLERLLREPRQILTGDDGPAPETHEARAPVPVPNQQDGPPPRSCLPERVENVLQWPCFFNGSMPKELFSTTSPCSAANPMVGNGSLAELSEMQPAEINVLLDNYFTYVHCKNPVLDELSTRRLVRRVFLDGIDWSPESCLAMIVCALGCVSGPFGPSHNFSIGTPAHNNSRVFFQAAQKRIGMLLVTSDVTGPQCLFLLGVYMMTVFQPVYAWRFFSQALAACQQFSFLACAQHVHSVSGLASDAVERGHQDTPEQAVYWSAWKSEREVRAELSLPDFTTHDSWSTLYPPFFPAPPSPSEEQSPRSAPDSLEHRSRAAWLFYLAEISLRRLNSRLCGEILTMSQKYAPTAKLLEFLSEVVPEYETQAREWATSLPTGLSIHSNPAEEDDVCRFVLRGHHINLFEHLYWAFNMACMDGHAMGRLVSPKIQDMAYKGLETHIGRLHVNEPGFMHRHHGTIFMVKSCTRSALLLVSSACSGMQMPPGWKDAVYKAIGLLEYWAREVPDLLHWKATLERGIGNAPS